MYVSYLLITPLSSTSAVYLTLLVPYVSGRPHTTLTPHLCLFGQHPRLAQGTGRPIIKVSLHTASWKADKCISETLKPPKVWCFFMYLFLQCKMSLVSDLEKTIACFLFRKQACPCFQIQMQIHMVLFISKIKHVLFSYFQKPAFFLHCYVLWTCFFHIQDVFYVYAAHLHLRMFSLCSG